ncbi:hypothetical protein NPX13_g8622 [Xylaria arbuscula]|uniref:C2H2-type domain-containing protein n=1 Tax=Xylaria arbuscula TaxID=114810 RepID=A0A9W8N7U4_9PEZI|nr:hypothetical protein NPX13_g8622 [Xylaria arbuscula]
MDQLIPSTQTDSDANSTDIPGHELLDASGPPINIPHARQHVFPLDPGTQHDHDQDVCVCIVCLTRCTSNAALRKHGLEQNHSPYGCICGEGFCRLDSLERHISSKNRVTRVSCQLCRKEFSRTDHLYQHLRTFHKIPTGRIPEDFNTTINTHQDHGSTHPQALPQYRCRVQGCMRSGELGFLRQIDLDEHMICMHNPLQNDMPIQQTPSNLTSTWTSNSLQQNHYPQMFGRDPYSTYELQPNLAGTFQVEEGHPGNDLLQTAKPTRLQHPPAGPRQRDGFEEDSVPNQIENFVKPPTIPAFTAEQTAFFAHCFSSADIPKPRESLLAPRGSCHDAPVSTAR